MKAVKLLIVASAAFVGCVSAQAFTGPNAKLYLRHDDATETSPGRFEIVQGTTISTFNATDRYESIMAVNGTVRTADYSAGGIRYRYTLDGVPTSPGPMFDEYHDYSANYFDGATDGKNNYAIAGEEVWKFDADWNSAVKLFDTAPREYKPYGGITYDPFRNSLWINGLDGFVRQYSMTGTELSRFSTRYMGRGGALAMDYTDQTLWHISNNNGRLYQTDRNGTILQESNSSGYVLSAEFDISAVPEPSTWAMMVVGIAGLASWARRRRAPPA